MSTKRKRPPAKKSGARKNKRKDDSDVDSELSDASVPENSTQPDEVLIAGHGDALDEPTQLPQELLKTLVKPSGQLFLFGLVNWDIAGRRENKTGTRLHPNIHSPQRFTDLKVSMHFFFNCGPCRGIVLRAIFSRYSSLSLSRVSRTNNDTVELV